MDGRNHEGTSRSRPPSSYLWLETRPAREIAGRATSGGGDGLVLRAGLPADQIRHRARARAHLPGRVPGDAEPVPGPAGRAWTPARPSLPPAVDLPRIAQPVSPPLLGPLASRGRGDGQVLVRFRSWRACRNRGRSGCRCWSGSCSGSSTSPSSTSASSSTRSGGSRFCSRPGSSPIFLGNARTPPPFPVLLALPVARLPRGAGRRAHQAPWRSMLARAHLHGIPPRDPAHAEPAELRLPPAPASVPPRRGPRQLRRPARRAVPPVPSAAHRRGRRPAHDRRRRGTSC